MVVFQNLIMIYFPRIFLLSCPKGKKLSYQYSRICFLCLPRGTRAKVERVPVRSIAFTFRQGDHIVAPNHQNICEQAAKNPGGLRFSLVRDKISFCSEKFAADHESKNTLIY